MLLPIGTTVGQRNARRKRSVVQRRRGGELAAVGLAGSGDQGVI